MKITQVTCPQHTHIQWWNTHRILLQTFHFKNGTNGRHCEIQLGKRKFLDKVSRSGSNSPRLLALFSSSWSQQLCLSSFFMKGSTYSQLSSFLSLLPGSKIWGVQWFLFFHFLCNQLPLGNDSKSRAWCASAVGRLRHSAVAIARLALVTVYTGEPMHKLHAYHQGHFVQESTG